MRATWRRCLGVGGPPIAAVAAAVAVVLWMLQPLTALAAPIAGSPIPSVLTADVPPRTVIGSKVAFPVHLTTRAGAPIGNAPVLLYLGTALLPRADRTDGTGTLTVTIRATDLPQAGTVSVTLRYAGSGSYVGSSVTTSMVVAPATVRIATVPAVAGTHVTLGSFTAVTAANGIAAFEIPKVGVYPLAPKLDAPNAPTRISFDRWADGAPGSNRELSVVGDTELVLGLVVAYEGSLSFLDPEGRSVDPARVDSVTVVGSNGQTQTVTDYAHVWLTAGSSTVQPAGLAAVGYVYRIAQVTIGGSNVVNAGQQTWQPTPNGARAVQVLLYSLSVSTHDALFGTPVQGGLDLVMPDGNVRRSTVGRDGTLQFDALPRGQYTLKLHATGLTTPTPVALSRSQEASLRIITLLDILVALAVLISVVVGLVLVGRRHQLGAFLARAQADPRTIWGTLGLPARRRNVPETAPATAPERARAGLERARAIAGDGSARVLRAVTSLSQKARTWRIPTRPVRLAVDPGPPIQSATDAGAGSSDPPTWTARLDAADRARLLGALTELADANELLGQAAASLGAALRSSRDLAAAAPAQAVASQVDVAWRVLHEDLARPKAIVAFVWELEPFYERARLGATAALTDLADRQAQRAAGRALQDVLAVLPAIQARVARERLEIERAGSAPARRASQRADGATKTGAS